MNRMNRRRIPEGLREEARKNGCLPLCLLSCLEKPRPREMGLIKGAVAHGKKNRKTLVRKSQPNKVQVEGK